jgi:hypothetical protein
MKDTYMSTFLSNWFDTMDSDTPENVLNLITDDFVMSVQFSTGTGTSAEFVGDKAALEVYLEQREVNVRLHEVVASSTVGNIELVLGRVTRDGVFEASFNATAKIDEATGLCSRLMIARTPGVEF